MAEICWDDVVNHAPALTSVSEKARDDILEYVNTLLNVSVFDGEDGYKTQLARIYLAAHFGTIVIPGGISAGEIASMSEGGVSISFASALAGNNLNRTKYGSQYSELVRTSMARFPIVM